MGHSAALVSACGSARVHFSSVCALEWEGSLAQKQAAMDGVSGNKSIWDIGPLGAFIHKDDYLSNFLLPLWLQLRNIYAKSNTFWQ